MPLQNRVTPYAELIASPARGTMMGNRGGRLHDAKRRLTARRWTSKQWICCKLEFNDRHRSVWGDSYTELFFLDEVTALAAGHRPCFECRRKDAETFATLFSGAGSLSARPRESGDPGQTLVAPVTAALDSRLRGNERSAGLRHRASAATMDTALHAERLSGKAKRLHRRDIDTLPDGAMIVLDGEVFAVRAEQLLPWAASGYGPARPRPKGGEVGVLTPPSILAVLARGYGPQWHPGAA
jgi:hypothetical protein